MKKYRIINLTTKEEELIEADTISTACAKLGWIPTMINAEVIQEKSNN